MKLTQSQRADLLAQLFISRSGSCATVADKLSYSKQLLEAYEAELATWPPEPPAVYGPEANQMVACWRGDVPPGRDSQALAVLN